jgi:hypothetical protein
MASDGGIVAIAKGSYDEEIVLPTGVTLWGACVAETVLTSSEPAPLDGFPIFVPGTVEVSGAGATIRNLQISGGRRPGIGLHDPAVSVHIEDLVLNDNEGRGVNDLGGTLSARSVVVSATRPYAAPYPDPFIGLGGRAFNVNGEVTISRALLQANVGVSMFFFTEAHLELEDAAIVGTVAGARDPGAGIVAVAGSVLDVTRTFVAEGAYAGLLAIGSSASVRDTVVREVNGAGLDIASGGELDISRVWVDAVRGTAVNHYDDGSGTRLMVSDTVITNTDLDDTGYGAALGAGSIPVPGGLPISAELLVQRAWLEGNRGTGVGMGGTGFTARFEDLVVRDMISPGTGDIGGGMVVERGATVEVVRALFERSADFGLVLTGWIEGEEEVGAATPPWVSLTDVRVTDTQGQAEASDFGTAGALGRGLQIQSAELVGERIQIDGNHEVGLTMFRSGATLRDLSVTNTRGAQCGGACEVDPFGHGILKGPGADLSVTNFIVDGSLLCGLLVTGNGATRLHEGLVSNNLIGVCLQDTDVTAAELSGTIVYSDNEQNLDATDLPLPALNAPL